MTKAPYRIKRRSSPRRTRRARRHRFIGITALAAAALGLAGCASQDAAQATSRQSRTDDGEGRQPALAEPSVSGQLGLDDAVKLALLYSKDLLVAEEETALAHGRTLEAQAKALPSVTARGGYMRLDEAPTIAFGDQSFEMAVVDNYAASLEVRQPLYAGGAIDAALKAARLNRVLSDEKIREQVEKVVFATVSAFYDALLAQRLFDVNRDAVTTAEAHLDDVNKRHKQGTASDYDVLRAEVDVSNFKAEMIRQRNRITRAQTVLLKNMGVSQEPGKGLTLADALQYQTMAITWDAAVQAALGNRPELHEAELAVRIQKETVRTAQSAYRPSINAVATGTEANPAPHTPIETVWGAGWTAGVEVSLPIFDMGREGKVATAEAQLRQREKQLAEVRERILMEVRQALLSIQDADEFVDSQKLNLNRAAESLRLVEVGYREGVQSQVDVTDAQTAVTQTRGFYYQAIYDHCMARLALQRAIGRLGVAGQEQGRTTP